MKSSVDLFGDFKPINIDSSMKFPLVLVLDVSGSMTQRTPYGRKTKIAELNEKVKMLLDYKLKIEGLRILMPWNMGKII